MFTWVAWRGVTQRRAVARGACLVGVGLVAFPVGLGIGVPHLAKTGLQPVSLAGAVVAVAGLVLLVSGAATLLRASTGWRRVPTAASVLLLMLVSTWTIGQAVAATNVPRTGLGGTTPADLGVPYRDVEFPARDGVVLAGWYIPSQTGAAVVLLHGAGSTRSAVLEHAVVLAGHGYGVLLYDARGHGRSEGRAMDFGWFGDDDLAGAVSFLVQQPDVSPTRVAAVGLSMGGEEAIGAAASDVRIRAVVAEGATNRVAADEAWLSEEFGIRGALQERVEALTYWVTDLLSPASPPIPLRAAVAAAAPRPVLLIAGGSMPDEGRAARFIQSGAPGSVELWVVPETGHTDGLQTYPDEWEDRVVGFLDRSLP